MLPNNLLSRRDWLKATSATVAGSIVFPQYGRAAQQAGPDVLDIGSRRELFVDDYLIGELNGAERRLHRPVPRDIALTHDAPWEGSGSGYHSVFQDGDLYRMYYKAWQLTIADGKLTQPHPLLACYAESDDGIHWRKPDLGIVEFEGSKQNNIVLATGRIDKVEADPGHIAVFRDDNPDAPAESRYKAIIRSRKPNGLLPFQSADGLHWGPMSNGPVITYGAFDSQNLAFWDPIRGEYRAYFRFFNEGRRDILTATSPDYVTWSDPQPLVYPGAPPEQLYTNQIKPYHRAPHIFIGFPTRYVDRGWTPSTDALPEREHRRMRSSANQRFGTAVSEGLLMSSRDGATFDRWGEAFLPPGPERPGSWNYGQQYIAWHVVETESALPGAPKELSLYASESYWTGNSSAVRRYSLRMDGFVSIRAPLSGGELVTKPLRIEGGSLTLNFASSAAGGVQVEIQDAAGKPLPGFTLDDCPPLYGDSIDRQVTWKGGSDVSSLAGTPVRLRFALKDADVYSLQFAS